MFTVSLARGDITVSNWGYQLQGLGGSLIDPVALANETHDLIVTDFSRDGTLANAFTPYEVAALQNGPGGQSVAASYISIGEASEFREHWDSSWTSSGDASGVLTGAAPSWLGPVNPSWPESRKVRYWDEDWQDVIFNDAGTGWLDTIVSQGFDAAYLDIVDAYYYWSAEVAASDKIAGDPVSERDAAARMIDFIVAMTDHARQKNPDFFVIPQNGIGIIDALGASDADRVQAFFGAVGAVAVEDVYYRGNLAENNALNTDDYRIGLLDDDFALNDVPVLIVDYINDPAKLADFETRVTDAGFYPYAAPSRDLDVMGPELGGSDVVEPDEPPVGTQSDDVLTGGASGEFIEAFAGDDLVRGNGGDDTIRAGRGDDTVEGNNGDDNLFGASGQDSIFGDDGDDNIFGQRDDDALFGGYGNDVLTGAAGDDLIVGGAGDDKLRGGKGADTLDGGAGNDVLSGALGADIFVFASGYGSDKIFAFEDDTDALHLDDALWSGRSALSVSDVLSDFATQVSAKKVVLNFETGEELVLLNGASLSISQLQNDIEII